MGKHNIVLITGGLGYIGAPTAYALSRMGFRVVVFDSARFCQSIPGIKEVPNPGIGKKENYIFVQGDIRDISALTLVMKKYQPGIVIHFAALTSATESEKQKALYVDTNVRGTKNRHPFMD
ncbi:MAG: UDP-glucose 4-epimerase [Candidatus Gottesmanbacteria bacterium GW2011_GWA1_44_24b]|uniref:UDP-glucose 4-epimerase n=1 Tax=Candidatus Gottesmanbacteria bacterium GW2011_GWA1_44_24b TaxID=1618437 RepID=A0A0G1IPW2_9BACT|nr:MAG: UDP-glucose 4-epimerase [Candidatus Gottesmanbacteria bacterium GW2011_GWA1_44_24b]